MMKCENEFGYTLEESYNIIRRLYKFEHNICDFVRNMRILRPSLVEHSIYSIEHSDEYIKGYNTAIHEHAMALEHIIEEYRNSRVVCLKDVK